VPHARSIARQRRSQPDDGTECLTIASRTTLTAKLGRQPTDKIRQPPRPNDRHAGGTHTAQPICNGLPNGVGRTQPSTDSGPKISAEGVKGGHDRGGFHHDRRSDHDRFVPAANQRILSQQHMRMAGLTRGFRTVRLRSLRSPRVSPHHPTRPRRTNWTASLIPDGSVTQPRGLEMIRILRAE
jgi:hypothetical protein